jgi:hypothetical protein
MSGDEDQRWWRAHQYVTRSGAYRWRERPACETFCESAKHLKKT